MTFWSSSKLLRDFREKYQILQNPENQTCSAFFRDRFMRFDFPKYQDLENSQNHHVLSEMPMPTSIQTVKNWIFHEKVIPENIPGLLLNITETSVFNTKYSKMLSLGGTWTSLDGRNHFSRGIFLPAESCLLDQNSSQKYFINTLAKREPSSAMWVSVDTPYTTSIAVLAVMKVHKKRDTSPV